MSVKTRDASSKKTAPRKSAAKAAGATKSGRTNAGDEAVTIDRRRGSRRNEGGASTDEGESPAAPAPKLERRAKTQRRRQIDPTTCERDYSNEEVEFMNAMDDYKRKSGRMFPTCSEVLEVVHNLGYVKLSPVGRAMLAADSACDPMCDSDAVSSRS